MVQYNAVHRARPLAVVLHLVLERIVEDEAPANQIDSIRYSYIYIYIYTHTCIHIHIYIYIYTA